MAAQRFNARSLLLASSSRNAAVMRQAPALARCLATQRATPPPSAANSAPPTGSPAKPLDWGTYLSMRHSRRIFGQVTTIPTTAVALMGAGNFFLTKTVDPSAPLIMGLDPVYIYAAATLATTGLGYLCGPSLGTFLWNTLNRSRRAEVEKMDEKFWQHITRNRVDPSRQTMQNRLPDFYGEKISSIASYRQWLRDQNAFRRKTAHGVQDDLTA